MQIYGILIAETSFRYRSLRGPAPDCGLNPVVPEKGRLFTTLVALYTYPETALK